jgi:hypothetical protein
MRFIILSAALLGIAAPAPAARSLFAQLVDATANDDEMALARVLSSETLSTSTGVVLEGNRVNGGSMRHGVPSRDIAKKLVGCAVKQWRDTGTEQGSAYILWECPARRAPENECYFYSYRAEMLDPRYHPANLFIAETPSWDSRCGVRFVAPAPPPRL